MEEEWGEMNTVSLRCPEMWIPVLWIPHSWVYKPCSHFAPISLHITKDPANVLSEKPCESQCLKLWATAGVGSRERCVLRAILRSWRVVCTVLLCQCYLGQAWWHKSNRAWRRLQMGKWWYYSWIHEKQLPGAAKDPKKQCHKKVRSLLALLSMPGFQIWRVD